MSNSSTPTTNHLPGTSSEWQLYLILQRANLLQYYDTFISQGGDDVQQLLDAGEEEFLEIMALVGMASKPLHVRRLQKTLQEFGANPTTFQLLALQKTGLNSVNTSSVSQLIQNAAAVATIPFCSASTLLHPSLLTVSANSSSSSGGAAGVASSNSPMVQSSSSSSSAAIGPSESPGAIGNVQSNGSSSAAAVIPGSSILWQTTGLAGGDNSDFAYDSYNFSGASPMLTEGQIHRLSECATELAKSLPEYEPKMVQNKKKIGRDLLNVMDMAEETANRLDEFRKYAAIYGRFDAKRKADKPLTFHEISVNEAAAQICLHRPALLTRRDELFPLARQVVRDAGYNYLKSGTPHRNDADAADLLLPMELNRKRSTPAESLSSGGDKSPASCTSNYSQSSPIPQQEVADRSSVSPNPVGVAESKKRRRIDDISLELSNILQEQDSYKVRVCKTEDLDELNDLQRQLQRLSKRQLELTDEQSGLCVDSSQIEDSSVQSISGDEDDDDTDDQKSVDPTVLSYPSRSHSE